MAVLKGGNKWQHYYDCRYCMAVLHGGIIIAIIDMVSIEIVVS